MRRKMKLILILCVLGALFLVQCGGKEKAKDIYYQVGKGAITKDDVDRVWMGLPEEMKYQYLDKMGRQELLNNLVSLELLYQEALRQKLDQDPLVKFKLERSEKNILAQELIAREVHNLEELYLFYQENFIRLDELSFSSQGSAEAVYQQLIQGADFKKLKEKLNPAKKDQELGYLTRDDLIAQYGTDAAMEVFNLAKDQKYTKPVKTQNGFSIFYVLEKPGNLDPKGYDLVQNRVISLKQEEIYRGLVNDLRNRIPVKPYQKNIDEFLKIGEEWEKRRLAPEPGETINPTPPSKIEPSPTAPSAGATSIPLPQPSTTIKPEPSSQPKSPNEK